MTADCNHIRPRIAGYIDHEIDPNEVRLIKQHMDDCPECADEAAQQKQVKDAVHRYAAKATVPAPLRSRIRRVLDRHAHAFSFWEQIRQLFQWQPVPAIVTAGLLVILPSLLTYWGTIREVDAVQVRPAMTEARLEGEVICVDCALLIQAHETPIHDASHHLGLRTTDGSIWSILPNQKGHELIEKAGKLRQHVKVEGQVFPRMNYVQVKGYSFL